MDQRAARPDQREVIADAAASAHRLGRLIQRVVDRRHAVVHAADRIANRLHETVDQRGRDLGTGGRVDPAARNETGHHRFEKALLPMFAQSRLLDRGEASRDPAAHLIGGLLVGLRILFEQNVQADRLFVQQCCRLVELHPRILKSMGELSPVYCRP